MTDRYLAELHPEPTLVVDEPPPVQTTLWLITKYGTGFKGLYHPEYDVVAWCPLPKLTPEQKERLRALEAAGIDTTKTMRTA